MYVEVIINVESDIKNENVLVNEHGDIFARAFF